MEISFYSKNVIFKPSQLNGNNFTKLPSTHRFFLLETLQAEKDPHFVMVIYFEVFRHTPMLDLAKKPLPKKSTWFPDPSRARGLTDLRF